MCPVYEICEVCDVDHSWDNGGSTCRWRHTAHALYWLDMHPDHPLVLDGLRSIDSKVEKIINRGN